MRTPLMMCWLVSALAATAHAQTTDAEDPIRCWWRTSTGAVAIGEPFEATLTCAARDQESVRTVADESRLPAAAIQLAPFEVLGGSHPSDLRSSTHRFFQYHYNLRIIDRDVIGHDATFPHLLIGYRVHTKTNGEWIEGRDRTYVMPGRSVHVLSLVPTAEDNIRDSGDEDFARIAAFRFRSRALNVAAVAFVLLGALVAIPAVAKLVRRGKAVDGLDPHKVRRRDVLAAVDAELDAVTADANGGWTAELAGRALNALRLTASCALNRNIAAQAPSRDGVVTGWLMTNSGVIRKRRVAIASALTPLDVRKAIEGLPLTTVHEHQQILERLGDAMETMTSVLYGARFNPQHNGLDEAVAAGRAASRYLRRRS